jgi:hypothetical protein
MAADKAVNILEDAPGEAQPTSAKDLRQAVRLADEMRFILRKMENLTQEIKDLDKRYDTIANDTLPNLMLAIGITNFKLDSGEIISIKDVLRGAIPSQGAIDKADGPDRDALLDRRSQCLAWLRLNGAESLIKNAVTVEFGKGHDKDAETTYQLMVKKGFQVKRDIAVNFQTLQTFLKDALKKGIDIPTEPFGLFVGKVAELKTEKK